MKLIDENFLYVWKESKSQTFNLNSHYLIDVSKNHVHNPTVLLSDNRNPIGHCIGFLSYRASHNFLDILIVCHLGLQNSKTSVAVLKHKHVFLKIQQAYEQSREFELTNQSMWPKPRLKGNNSTYQSDIFRPIKFAIKGGSLLMTKR